MRKTSLSLQNLQITVVSFTEGGKYEEKDLMAKARVISAKQLNHIEPALQSARNQKDINNLINSAVQEILLNKASTKEVLDKVSKDWKLLTD